MAINPSNSNALSVKSLPKAQFVVNGDNFIVDTPNGTQAIDFKNFNVVKTDLLGNATVNGNISATNAVFGTTKVNTLTAGALATLAGPGISQTNGFYDRFTIQNGLILSASTNTTSNPVYTTITGTVLPAVTSYFVNIYKRTVDEPANGLVGTAVIPQGATRSSQIIVSNFFQRYPSITVGMLQANPCLFLLSPGAAASIPNNGYVYLKAVADSINQIAGVGSAAKNITSSLTALACYMPVLTATPIMPYIDPTTVTQGVNSYSNDLAFYVNIAYPLTQTTTVYWRILATY
jgi:hypothetical protein